MLDCTSPVYWQPILTYVLPPVGALLSATALWVASKARTTSVDAQSTSQAAVSLSLLHSEPPDLNVSALDVPDQRKP
jgi:hypothetical protein